MYTDKCEIKNNTYSEQFGEKTSVIVPDVSCRVEQEDAVGPGQNGNKVAYKRLFIFPPSVVVNKGDEIKTTKERGVAVTDAFATVDKVFKVGGNSPHHVEVYVL